MGGQVSIPIETSDKMQVIGAGYSRTGTTTFALAMEILLDGPACHGGSQVIGREDGKDADVRKSQTSTV